MYGRRRGAQGGPEVGDGNSEGQAKPLMWVALLAGWFKEGRLEGFRSVPYTAIHETSNRGRGLTGGLQVPKDVTLEGRTGDFAAGSTSGSNKWTRGRQCDGTSCKSGTASGCGLDCPHLNE